MASESEISYSPRHSQAYAREMDHRDELRDMRDQFFIPEKASFRERNERPPINSEDPIIYLAGSAIGLQPRRVTERTQLFLDQWAGRGILAGFENAPGSNIPSWLEAEKVVARIMAPIVGAREDEVVLMGSLTTNLHFLLASFYRPNSIEAEQRTKILIEERAFSSDRYAIESQIALHGLEQETHMIEIPVDASTGLLDKVAITRVIDAHATTTSILLLSGVQYHTGQVLDIPAITAYAHERGIIVAWDLAHAVGNVELKLHEWDVDFAVWCSYKYLNAGPGATAGAFVHERHFTVGQDVGGMNSARHRPRLAGWWGAPASQRFGRLDCFTPAGGAAGFQLSSPSILDITALTAALSVFENATMNVIIRKSIRLTAYLDTLLDDMRIPLSASAKDPSKECFLWTVITPRDPKERGAMLSLQWSVPKVLHMTVERMKDQGIVVDMKRPDVLRITPAPLYNTFEDVWTFAQAMRQCVEQVLENSDA